MFYEVIPSKLFGKRDILTYFSDEPLENGTIVQIPLGKNITTGIVYKKVARPNFETKSIIKILYSTPLPKHLVDTIDFFHTYYLIPRPLALSLLLPKGIMKKRRNSLAETPKKTEQNTQQYTETIQIQLNQHQKIALKAIKTAPEATKLLHGVTGSGKTNIYLKMAKNALQANQSVIILVPEIALASQLVRIFQDTFNQKITLIHSKQTEAERHLNWEKELANTDPHIIIGPRSALFAPIKNLGLIIIDECHESTYFQENSPKYSTLRVASFMAKTLKIDCIEGSATPTVSDYYLAKTKKSLITITEKAKPTAITPNIQIIDFKSRDNFSKNRYFSNQLLNSIEYNLKNNYQTLIFHNRRGSAPLTICESCGEEILCPHCLLPLTLHSDSYELICHTCGFKRKVPHACEKCGSPNIIHKGFGTKLLETELNKLFKNAKIARFDADNKKSETLNSLYDQVKNGEINIIIGTQSIAKGLDLPKLATVGIVQADSGLSLPDYSAEERTFELITQVIGRVGRGHIDIADVFIQTFQPESPIIKYAIDSDYEKFANFLLKKRKQSIFPPFSYIAKLEITYKTEKTVLNKIYQIQHALFKNPDLLLSMPAPTFHEHTSKGYTWQLIIRAKSRQKLIKSIENLNIDNVVITIDPPTLL